MHSIAITILISAVILARAVGFGVPYSVGLVVLALAVGLIGLPHGSLDHLVGRKLLKRLPFWPANVLFFGGYLAIALMVIVGWFLSPFLTVLAFFCLSAWHFGLEEDERSSLSRAQWVAMVARGGMVIWVLAWFHAEAVTGLLSQIMPDGDGQVASQLVSLIVYLSPALLLLTIYDLIWYRDESQPLTMGFDARRQHQIRNIAFFALFAIADPLVSFGVYFCGWHSIRGLVHLREQIDLPRIAFFRKLLPISIAAIALFLIGFFISLNSGLFSQAVLQTIFVGLSAVAIPHLMLHVISDSVSLRQTEGAAA